MRRRALYAAGILAASAASLRPVHADWDKTTAQKVACIGDSITFGAGINDPNRNSYPAQLNALAGGKLEVKNFGVSGRTLLKKGDYPYWATKEFQNAQTFQPDIVVIMLGTNDTKPQNWKYADEFTSDYRALVATFQALPSHPKIYLCLPIPVPGKGNFGINEAGVEEQKWLIEAVAVETHSSITDTYSALKGHDSLLPDNVHPNAEGAGLMAKAVQQALLPPVR